MGLVLNCSETKIGAQNL